MIEEVIERWYQHLRGDLPDGLDELLDDDVTLYSPIVYTPLRGKEITKLYLTAAGSTFNAEASFRADRDGEHDAVGARFRYTKKVLAGDTAVLEFETSMGDTYVNGVDIIRANEAGRIIEFRVMVRPLQAVHAVHELMGNELETLQQA